MKTTVAQILKHDFTKGSLSLYDSNSNEIYYEKSNGYWSKQEYDTNGNRIYYETSTKYWSKSEYDSNGNQIYFEKSNGYWYKYEFDSNGKVSYFEKRPKSSCEGKIVEIDGKKYQLKEFV
jgi:uncharacterized membrane protein